MKIGDLCTYAPKSSIKAGDAIIDGRYMFFTSSSDENKRYSDYQLDCEGIIMGTGGNATLHYYNGKFATSTDCVVLLSNETIRCKYLYYFFLSNMDILESGFKGAGLKHTNKNYINSINISSVPSFEMQDRVIKVLDKVQSIIDKRQQQLEKLDELVKSRFIEMFGTLSCNERRYPMCALKDACRKITDGKHGGCEQEHNSGYYYVGAREIYDGAIHYDTAPQIVRGDFEKDYRRCNLEQGDFVLVNTGATIGKSAIAKHPLTEHTLLQKSVAMFKVKTELISAVFLKCCYDANPEMYTVKSASAQPNLLLSRINSTQIYLPPIELQRQFAAFVKQIDKSKFEIKQSLEKLELLKKVLMQKYFG